MTHLCTGEQKSRMIVCLHAAFIFSISDDGSDVNAYDCVLNVLLYMIQQDSVNHTACDRSLSFRGILGQSLQRRRFPNHPSGS